MIDCSPLVSIIIPSYNVEKWVGDCLQSCLEQTYKNLEIIVVDDGSRDNTLDVVRKFRDERLKIIEMKNQGANFARNYGFQAAKGEWIMFMDADDFLHREKVAIQMDFIDGDKSILTCSQTMLFRENQTSRAKELAVRPIEKASISVSNYSSYAFLKLVRIDKSWLNPQTAAWLFPRECIEKTGGFNPILSIGQDLEYWTRILPIFQKVKLLDYHGVFYRKHGPHGQNTLNLNSFTKLREWGITLSYIERNLSKWPNNGVAGEVIVYEYMKYVNQCITFGIKFGIKQFQINITKLYKLRQGKFGFDLFKMILKTLLRRLRFSSNWKKVNRIN